MLHDTIIWTCDGDAFCVAKPDQGSVWLAVDALAGDLAGNESWVNGWEASYWDVDDGNTAIAIIHSISVVEPNEWNDVPIG